jgi:3-oxoacyl-[acyl-carrier-protein] synthase-1
MRQAIADAGLSASDIDLVMAHATSTPTGDEAEGKALTNVFNSRLGHPGPIITATKALTGHEFWMAGASQVVYGMLMTGDGFVTGNHNLQSPDSSVKNLHLPTENVYADSRFLLCNAAGFGGTNACLVIKNNQ